MDTKTAKLLETFIASPQAKQFAADAESDRLSRRRKHIEALRAVRARAPLVEKAAAALEAEIAAARQGYADAEAALGAAAGKLWGAQRRLDETWNEHQRSEGSALAAVLEVSNAKRQEILLQPLREETEKTHATKPMVETDFDANRPGRVAKSHRATAPSIRARAAFIERAGNLAQEYFLERDDDDATLFRIRELVISSAPSAEKFVEIGLDRDGGRRATEAAIDDATRSAEKLFAGLGAEAEDEPSAVVLPIKAARGK